MAGKFNKFLAFTAAAGAIAAGVYYYLQNKNANQYDDFDDDVDFDDFSEDLEEEDPEAETQRSYVDLNLEKAAEHLSEHAKAAEVQEETAAPKETAAPEEITEQEIKESEASVAEPEASVADSAAPQDAEEEDSFYAAVEEAFDTVKNTLSFETESAAESLKTTIEEFFDDEDDMDSI